MTKKTGVPRMENPPPPPSESMKRYVKTGKKSQRSIRLDSGVISIIEKLAAKNNRTFNNQVETILIDHIKNL